MNKILEHIRGFFLFFGLIFFLCMTQPVVAENCENIILNPSGSNLDYERGQVWATCGYELRFQGDGNLVLYNSASHPLWSSGTHGKGVDRLSVQTDGNVVLYRGWDAVWSSGTCCEKGKYLAIQSDGNVVIYTAGGAPIYATHTASGAPSPGDRPERGPFSILNPPPAQIIPPINLPVKIPKPKL